MVNFKDTFEQYKNGFDGNLKKFTSFHKGIDLTAVDFINREKSEWLKIESIFADKRDEKLGYMSCLTGELFEMQFEVNKAIVQIGINGEEFIKFKCDAILKFLESKLNAIINIDNLNNHDKIRLNITDSNSIKLKKIKNIFDLVSTEKIYSHYHFCLVEKKHMSEDELINFLELALEKKTPPSKKIILNNVQNKEKVMSYFHYHFKVLAAKPRGKQTKYAKLLADYFEGYETKNIKENFARQVFNGKH